MANTIFLKSKSPTIVSRKHTVNQLRYRIWIFLLIGFIVLSGFGSSTIPTKAARPDSVKPSANEQSSLPAPDWTVRVPEPGPGQRRFFAMAYDSSRGVTVFFGGQQCCYQQLGDTWEWNGNNWIEMHPAHSPSIRMESKMVYDANRGQVILFGGRATGVLNDTWLWDGTDWTQLSPSASPPARYNASLVYDSGRGITVLFGGMDGSDHAFNDTWEWDGTNWIQRTPVTVPSGRSASASAYDEINGKTVLFGGYDGTNYFNDTWEWDGTDWLQRSPATVPGSRTLAAMAYDPVHSKLVMFGGYPNNNETWVWDGINWTLLSPSTPATPRAGHSMVFDIARAEVVMYGGSYCCGSGFDGAPHRTWTWDGNTWYEHVDLTQPTPRRDHAMAYDANRHVTVLFGGRTNQGTGLNDTWEWNGSNWVQRFPAHNPSARSYHAMAYDPDRRVVVLYGGGINLGDTWEWNGVDWIEINTATSPGGTYRLSMVYDQARHYMMLMAGGLDNIWTYNGVNWARLPAAHQPPGIYDSTMSFDASRNVVVLTSPSLSKFWEWDGLDWTEKSGSWYLPVQTIRSYYDNLRGLTYLYSGLDVFSWNGVSDIMAPVSNSPTGRFGFAMVYDSYRAKAVMFGGWDGDSTYDTWEFGGITLQALVDAATPGSVITLDPLVYTGATINKPLTIQGVSGTVITPGSSGLIVTADNVTIQNMAIDMLNSSSHAIETGADVANLVIRNLDIHNGSGDGIHIGNNVTNLQILDNYIHDMGGDGLEYASAINVNGVHEVQGNLFQNNTGYGVNNASTTHYGVAYNAWGSYDGPSGTGGDGVNGLLAYTPYTYVGVTMSSSGTPVSDKVSIVDQITYTIKMDAREVYGAEFSLKFDPTRLQVVSVTNSGTFGSGSGCTHGYNNITGVISFCGYRTSALEGLNQPVFQVVFQGNTIGRAILNLDETTDRFAMVPTIGASTNIYASVLADGLMTVYPVFNLTGRIDLQGRANDSGAALSLAPGLYQGYGPFNFSPSTYWGAINASDIVTDTYHIVVSMPRYLDLTEASGKSITILSSRALSTLVLAGGDANDDNTIDITDAVIIASQFGNSGGQITDPRTDINNDGVINILDLVLMGGNFNKTSITAYSTWVP